MSGNKKGCGCNSGCEGSQPEADGLLVKATANSASRCGTGSTPGAPEVVCTKEDAAYDLSLGAYTIPSHGNNAAITVCDGSLYTVGQWIQFLKNGNILQIQTINANQIMLRNGCPNNAVISENTPGDILPAQAPFIPVGEPACLTQDEKNAQFNSVFSQVTEVCVPNLVATTSNTSEMEFVGWKRADEGDSEFKKCMTRIRGLFKKGKSIFMTEIETVPTSDMVNYRPLHRHKTSGEVREMLAVSENPDLDPDKKYVKMYVQGAEALVGPAYVYTPLDVEVFSNSSLANESAWLNIPEGTPLVQTINLSIPAINDLEILGDDFYVIALVNIGTRNLNGFATWGLFEINDVLVSRVGARGFPGVNTFTIPVKVDKATKTMKIKYDSHIQDTGTGGILCHVSVKLVGAYL